MVGYGNESPSKTDPTTQDITSRNCTSSELNAYTNSGIAYGPLAAEILAADYQINAYSGLGMTRHYSGNTSFLPFQDYYQRTIQSQSANTNDFNSWSPQVVVIALGTNDFSTELGENDIGVYTDREDLYESYRTKYHLFIDQIRAQYPGVQILTVGNNLWPDDEMRKEVSKVVSEEESNGNTDVHYLELTNITGYGCGWHPDKATHKAWSILVSDKISEIMNW